MQISLMPLVGWTLPLQALALFQPLAYQVIIDQAVAHGGLATLWVMLAFMALGWLLEAWIQWHRQRLFWLQLLPIHQHMLAGEHDASKSADPRQALIAQGPWGVNTLQALDMGGGLVLLAVLFLLYWPVALMAAGVWLCTTLWAMSIKTGPTVNPQSSQWLWNTASRMMQWLALGWSAHETLQGHLSMGSLIAINLMMGRIQGSWPVTPQVVKSWRRWRWAKNAPQTP